MATVSSTAAARSRTRSGGIGGRASSRSSRPRSASAAPAAVHVPWNRLARTAMLIVMIAIAYLYLSAGLRLFSAWGESKRDAAQVRALERQNRSLESQHAVLTSPGSVLTQARGLGMIRRGEQGYIVSGLPDN